LDTEDGNDAVKLHAVEVAKSLPSSREGVPGMPETMWKISGRTYLEGEWVDEEAWKRSEFAVDIALLS
jgi:hypothetical protein